MRVTSVGVVPVLATLAIVAWLLAAHARETGPTAGAGQEARTEAAARAAGAGFQAAAPVLQAHLAEHGTYAGAALPPAYGVVVARAGGASYCLQTADGGLHVVGPGGEPAPGPC